MKLFLPLALISILASCTSPKDPARPSAVIPGQGAPKTNQGLDYVALGVGQAARTSHDVADDTVGYGGKVAVHQSKKYTKIGFNSVRRADDLALRESKRYTDYALDTYDKAADQEVRTVTGWSRFGSESAVRAFHTTKKIHQRTLKEYGDAVDRTYFSFWDIVRPPETKPWMVGSKNDCVKYCGGGVAVPGGVWTKDIPAETVVEEPVAEKNPVRIMK